MSSSSEPRGQELLQYLEGEVTEARAREIAALVEKDAALRSRLDRVRDMLAALRAPLPEATDCDLVEAIRQARESAPRPRASARLAGVALGSLAAAACAVLLMRAAPAPSEFRRKAALAGDEASVAERVGIRIFRETSGEVLPVVDRIRASDGLLFAYLNPPPSPFTHLMVFGVDAHGAVHWYYPAWERPEEDPASIPIRSSESSAELHERIAHRLEPGVLDVYAVFSRTALHVSALERQVSEVLSRSERPTTPPRLPLNGAGQQVIRLQVEP